MIIRNFYDARLAQASYLVACAATGEAIVIDPARDIRPYLEMAESLGVRVVAVTETHIHADFLSGTRQLSAETGATMYLSGEGGPEWRYAYASDPLAVELVDGDRIAIGNVSLEALHTPGHTPEHIAFLLTDHPVSSTPQSLFSGDLLFVGDVGRPDLLERAADLAGTMEVGARTLHQSLSRLRDLPDALLVWPGHGAGSACGKSLGGSPVTTLGYERATNWALLVSDETRFVDEILFGQPDPPRYFKEMKRLNRLGPPVLTKLPSVMRASQPVGQFIDVRSVEVIRQGVCDGAIAIPSGKSFVGYAGWVVRYGEPVTLLAESQAQADDAAMDLGAIGLDAVHAWIHPMDLDPRRFAPIPTVAAHDVVPDSILLDVRSGNERAVSHVAGSLHIPFGWLGDRLDEVPRDRPIVVHCALGGRSPVAYYILHKAGFIDVQELPGGMSAIEAETPDVVRYASPQPSEP